MNKERRSPLNATPEQAERLHHFAHDLRNRLAAIQQVLDQIGEMPTEQREELIHFAKQQYFRAMRSSEDLLDAFAVERGVGELVFQPVDLSALLKEAVSTMQHRFSGKSQTVHCRIPDHLMVNGDAHWLRELLLALLSNASKFSAPSGEVRIALHVEGARAVLEVQDHGVGMDADDLAKVFVRYAWLKSRPTAGEAQGRQTLGRARQWAEAHQGTLSATSPGPGKGSAFRLVLPLAQ